MAACALRRSIRRAGGGGGPTAPRLRGGRGVDGRPCPAGGTAARALGGHERAALPGRARATGARPSDRAARRGGRGHGGPARATAAQRGVAPPLAPRDGGAVAGLRGGDRADALHRRGVRLPAALAAPAAAALPAAAGTG